MPINVKAKTKSETELLDQATAQLLRAVKARARKTGKNLGSDQLRRQGYSEHFIARVEKA